MNPRFNLQSLNPPQREVVTTTEGPVLVLAGAGTGKTRAITHRVAYLLTHMKVAPAQILAVTFTNKAANEMKERIIRLVGKAKASGLTVCTFHSLCVRILRENASHVGLGKNFTIYDERDQVGLIRAALRERRLVEKGIDASVLLHRVSNAKSDLVQPNQFEDDSEDKYSEISTGVYETYQDMLLARNAVDFDDLIMKAILLLQQHPRILGKYHKRFQYLMVDEFQDTSRSQYILLELLAKRHGNLCVVGDDDQSIYGWRGAQVSNILNFEKDFKSTKVVKLEENYRSTGNILDIANAIISHNSKRLEKRLWTSQEGGSLVDHYVVGDEYDEAETVIQVIQAFHDRFGMEYGKAAVLYRSNVQSRVFEEVCRTRNIPYRLIGGQGFYDRKEVRDAVAYMKLFQNPRDEISMLRIINVPRRGIGETTLARVAETAHRQEIPVMDFLKSDELSKLANPKAVKAIGSFLDLAERYRKRFSEGSIDRALRSLLEDVDYKGEVQRSSKSEPEFLRRWENVMDLADSLGRYVSQTPDPSLSEYLDRVCLVTKEDKPDRKGPDNALTLMTIHSAKGLEFPAVFLVGMEEDILPHAKSLSDGKDSLSEERRLCYVAVTRAQKYLALFQAETRRKYGKARPSTPSKFLEEIPENLLQPRKGTSTSSQSPHKR